MATRRLLTSTRLPLPLTRHLSTLPTPTPTPSPSPPPLTLYDHLAATIKPKLHRLLSPDPRFLLHGTPHPSPTLAVPPLPSTRITVLPSGLRVATESNLTARSAAIGVWIDAGSRYEADEKGIGLLSVRLGTEKAAEVAEGVGGVVEGKVERERTAIWGRVGGEGVEKGIEVLGEVARGEVSEEVVERVKKSIVDEREKVGSFGDEVVFDHLHATAFQYTPLGKSVVGPVENIKSITKADIQEYISTHYAAQRTVIAAAGHVKHEEVVEHVKKAFKDISTNPTSTSQLVAREPANFTGSEVRIIDDDIPLARIAVGFNGASWTDPDSIALLVIQNILGSWDKSVGGGKHAGSELIQRVAIDEVAEKITAFNFNYKDTGLFGIYAVAKADDLDDLAYAMMYELSKLCYRVSEEDVIRAQNQLKSSLLQKAVGTSVVAEDIGSQLLAYGRRIPIAELYARIDAVDASTVKRVANRFIFDREVAIAAMGPIQSLRDYNWFRRRTYWLRY
ncbi:hypothetical protein Drorol1_Dr00018833 [Drosera rotundifolia]